MEAVASELNTQWAVVVPLIQAKQQQIARATSYVQEEGAVDRVGRLSALAESWKSRRVARTVQDQPVTDARGLTPGEQKQVEALRVRDREVRDHEQAHARVGGQYASEPTYSYQLGPDGQRYAIGGAVAIDVSPVRDNPMATILKMEVVKRAALAPAEPSSADRQVAAIADARRAQAVADLAHLRKKEAAPEFDRRA